MQSEKRRAPAASQLHADLCELIISIFGLNISPSIHILADLSSVYISFVASVFTPTLDDGRIDNSKW